MRRYGMSTWRRGPADLKTDLANILNKWRLMYQERKEDMADTRNKMSKLRARCPNDANEG